MQRLFALKLTDCGDHGDHDLTTIGFLFRLPFWLVVLIHGMVLCSSTQFSAQFSVAMSSRVPVFLPCLLLLQDPSGTFTKYVAGQNLDEFG